MRLDVPDIRRLLVERFLGERNIVFAPIHVTEDALPRPVAQFTQDASIPPAQNAAEPRSIIRRGSELHLKGLLHHQTGTHPRR